MGSNAGSAMTLAGNPQNMLIGSVLQLPFAGYAAAAAAPVVTSLVLLWLWRTRLQLRPRWSDAWRLRRAELAEVARIGVPGAAENAAYRLAFVASMAAVGTLGAGALAGSGLTDFAKAWAQTAPWRPEAGATLKFAARSGMTVSILCATTLLPSCIGQ
jgi:Na+/H+ antiporter NhaD/arsenite permease-like protein